MTRLLLYAVCGALAACASTPKTPAVQTPSTAQSTPSAPAGPVTWTQKLIDLGAVKKGEKKSTTFEFTNTSGGPLKIYHVDACECTTVEFPRSVIPAGEKRRLEVIFDSSKKYASETIRINVFFEKSPASADPPLVEIVQYKYTLL